MIDSNCHNLHLFSNCLCVCLHRSQGECLVAFLMDCSACPKLFDAELAKTGVSKEDAIEAGKIDCEVLRHVFGLHGPHESPRADIRVLRDHLNEKSVADVIKYYEILKEQYTLVREKCQFKEDQPEDRVNEDTMMEESGFVQLNRLMN